MSKIHDGGWLASAGWPVLEVEWWNRNEAYRVEVVVVVGKRPLDAESEHDRARESVAQRETEIRILLDEPYGAPLVLLFRTNDCRVTAVQVRQEPQGRVASVIV